jgi:DNA-binding CsgD family transcriptional regulator
MNTPTSSHTRPGAHSHPGADRHSLIHRLLREWQVLARRPAVILRARGWGLGVPFGDLDDLVASTGFWSQRDERLQARCEAADCPPDPGSSSPPPDEVLRRLLLVARVDDVAARVVLQRLLPGLLARARHWRGHPDGSPEAFDELVSAAWGVIRQFPVERRPTHLAAKLLRDAEYQAFVKATRRSLAHEFTEPSRLDLPVEHEASVDPLTELIGIVAVARLTTLTERDLQLVRLLIRGCSVVEMAAELGVSPRSVANHRAAMVHRLRSSALAA